MTTTRFCPTTNGDAGMGILHLGHLYTVKVNEYLAHSTGGKFILRMDDDQRAWIDILGKPAMRRNAEQIERELQLCGIKVDEVIYQSETHDRVSFSWSVDTNAYLPFSTSPETMEIPTVIGNDDPQYPYTPRLTVMTVLHDRVSKIDHVITGVDLLSRFSLYNYFCEFFNIKRPLHTFLPRLMGMNGQLDEISKTKGNYKIMSFIENGYTATDIDYFLRVACMNDTNGNWSLDNLKASPKLAVLNAA